MPLPVVLATLASLAGAGSFLAATDKVLKGASGYGAAYYGGEPHHPSEHIPYLGDIYKATRERREREYGFGASQGLQYSQAKRFLDHYGTQTQGPDGHIVGVESQSSQVRILQFGGMIPSLNALEIIPLCR